MRIGRTPPTRATSGQRAGIAVVAILPVLLVALALPLLVEGTLAVFAFPLIIVVVAGVTAVFGALVGLGALALGIGLGLYAGSVGGLPWSATLILTGAIAVASWLTAALARSSRPMLAALPALAIVGAFLLAGSADTIEAALLAAFAAVALGLLLWLTGPWSQEASVRPARWAEIVAAIALVAIGGATYGVSRGGGDLLGDATQLSLLGIQEAPTLPNGSPPDPFLLAARWQLEPQEGDRRLFSIDTGQQAPQNRPTWATFSTYNGIAWLEPPTYGVSGESVRPDRVSNPQRTADGVTRVDISVALPGQWVPTPQSVTQVLGGTATRVDPATGIVTALSSPADQSYDLRYRVAVAPARALESAVPVLRPGIDPAVLLPGPLPATLVELADDVAAQAGESTSTRLLLLAERLRANRFTAAEPQALAGGPPERSYAGLSEVLASGVGFQEQYAAIWALVARSWSIPTRLVIGFLPPGLDRDGLAIVRGRDVSIWAEARLEGLGWVAYQPSPQDRDAGRPPVVLPLRPAEEPPPAPDPAPTGATDADGNPVDEAAAAGPVRRAVSEIPWLVVVPALLVVLLAGWIAVVALRRRALRRRLRQAPPQESVEGAWRYARALLAEAWMPLPESWAPAVDAEAPDLPDVVAEPLLALAGVVGPARYGPGEVDAGIGEDAWAGVDALGAGIRSATGWRLPLRRVLVPLRLPRTAATTPEKAMPVRG